MWQVRFVTNFNKDEIDDIFYPRVNYTTTQCHTKVLTADHVIYSS